MTERKSDLADAIVKGPNPFFDGKVLYQPGERVSIDLSRFEGRDGKSPVLGKAPLANLIPAKDAPDLTQVPIAAVAPHAPNPEAPQGYPAGAKLSGSGRVVKDGQEFVPATRDAVQGQAADPKAKD